MKPETTTNDIRLTIAARTAATLRKDALPRIAHALDQGQDHFRYAERAVAARLASFAADAAVARIPAPRRKLAADTIAEAEFLAYVTARKLGGEYSGQVTHAVNWGETAKAETHTDKGETYSRACTYRKTDACHTITLDVAGVHLLVANKTLRGQSSRDGLPLIALYPDDSAVWMYRKGQQVVSQAGWIVGNAFECFHSIDSREHAIKGLAKKEAARIRESARQKLSRKQDRRAALVARLCHGAIATLADAKALGFCAPGIQAFQTMYGIGDEASLPELVRTGNPSAIRLAMQIARKA